uniref:Uncharacterized protein n=1 Tax=Prorocentrum micans TaxID=2945 RepID=A0A7S2TAH3_PROMC
MFFPLSQIGSGPPPFLKVFTVFFFFFFFLVQCQTHRSRAKQERTMSVRDAVLTRIHLQNCNSRLWPVQQNCERFQKLEQKSLEPKWLRTRSLRNGMTVGP